MRGKHGTAAANRAAASEREQLAAARGQIARLERDLETCREAVREARRDTHGQALRLAKELHDLGMAARIESLERENSVMKANRRDIAERLGEVLTMAGVSQDWAKGLLVAEVLEPLIGRPAADKWIVHYFAGGAQNALNRQERRQTGWARRNPESSSQLEIDHISGIAKVGGTGL